jgi:hypothetical protein
MCIVLQWGTRHLPLGALVRVQLEHELLLDELAHFLLEDSAWSRGSVGGE